MTTQPVGFVQSVVDFVKNAIITTFLMLGFFILSFGCIFLAILPFICYHILYYKNPRKTSQCFLVSSVIGMTVTFLIKDRLEWQNLMCVILYTITLLEICILNFSSKEVSSKEYSISTFFHSSLISFILLFTNLCILESILEHYSLARITSTPPLTGIAYMSPIIYLLTFIWNYFKVAETHE